MITKHDIIRVYKANYQNILDKWNEKIKNPDGICQFEGIYVTLDLEKLRVTLDFMKQLGITEEEVEFNYDYVSKVLTNIMIEVNNIGNRNFMRR